MEDRGHDSAYLLQAHASELLSKIKFFCRASQTTIDAIVSGINRLTDLYLDVLKDNLREKCLPRNGYLTIDEVCGFLNNFCGQSIFEGLQTRRKMEVLVKQSSTATHVELQQKVLTWKTVFSKNGVPKTVPENYGFVVPFLPQLQQLLNCTDVLECVDNPRVPSADVMCNVTDGLFYKHHEVVKRHGNKVLAFIIYNDDVEPTDACKSKTKTHKLRFYYWQLANIYPELRSTVKSINLTAIVKASVAKKFGNEPFLRDFIEGMKTLGTTGAIMKINGEDRLFHGILLFASGDTPALANLGGFKESHFALRPCRHCMVLRTDFSKNFIEDRSLLRRQDDHNKYLEVIKKNEKRSCAEHPEMPENMEEDITGVMQDEADKNYFDRADPSVNYGINGPSVLSEAPGFDVTKCLPVDIMHVLWEGVAELVCRLLLKELCLSKITVHPNGKRKVEKPILDLNYVNEIIQLCDFGHYKVSKPSSIEKKHLTSKLKQSASQMIVLAHTLPFIISTHVSSEKQQVLLQLLEISHICMSFDLKKKEVDDLKQMVLEFGTSFSKIYPDSVTLKLHSLIHLIIQMLLFGNPRQHWCFRFEAMHQVFTRVIDIIHNMKCLEFSLGTWHLNKRNSEIMAGKDNKTFLYAGDKISSLQSHMVGTLPEKEILLYYFLSLDENSTVMRAAKIVKYGNCYKNGVILFVGKTEEEKVFGVIHNIYVIEEEIVLVFKALETSYIQHLGAFEVTSCSNTMLCLKFSELLFKMPIAKFTFTFPRSVKSYLLMIASV